MQRVTVTLDDELVEAIDQLALQQGYQNRSEAVRDLVRSGLANARQDAHSGHCIATLTYVYDHEARELSKRLAHIFHDHHDLALTTTHLHLNHDSCLEVAVLRGATKDVQHLADHIIAERGVRHGKLVTIPIAEDKASHSHDHGKHHHSHVKVGNV